VSDYEAFYEKRFVENLKRYAALRERIKRRVEKILHDPYANTEFLADLSGKLNLRGCRSARLDRNFRIVFVICEECRRVLDCEYCFCEQAGKPLPDNTVVFLTFGPHDRAYAMQ